MTQTTNRKQQKHKCPRILQLFRAVLCDMAKDDDAVWWSNFGSQGRQNRALWLSPTLSPSPISYSYWSHFSFWSPSRRSCLGKATIICKMIFLEAQVQECQPFMGSQEGEQITLYTRCFIQCSLKSLQKEKRCRLPEEEARGCVREWRSNDSVFRTSSLCQQCCYTIMLLQTRPMDLS